jgi:hypothetical protein
MRFGGTAEEELVRLYQAYDGSTGKNAKYKIKYGRSEPTQWPPEHGDRVQCLGKRLTPVMQRLELVGDDASTNKEHRCGSSNGKKPQQIGSHPQDSSPEPPTQLIQRTCAGTA